MKKIVFIFLLKCSLTYAQRHIYYGFKAGLNKSQVIGDGYSGYNKKGFNGGLFSQLRLSENCTAQLEALFNDKGSHSKKSKNNYIQYYNIRLFYIDLPLLFQFHHKKISYEIGLGLGYLVDQGEYVENQSFHYHIDRFSSTEKSFNVGLGYSFNENWGLNCRYNNSIVPIRRTPSTQFNSVFTIALFYQTTFHKKNKQG